MRSAWSHLIKKIHSCSLALRTGAEPRDKNAHLNEPDLIVEVLRNLELNEQNLNKLLTQGCDINAANQDGWTPLTWSVLTDNLEMTRLFLSKPKIDVNKPDQTNFCDPLSYAVIKNNIPMVNLLLAKGANPNGSNNHSPLFFAIGQSSEESVNCLLATKSINVNQTVTAEKCTALMFAAYSNQTNIVKKLLSHSNINIDLVDSHNKTALMYATDEVKDLINCQKTKSNTFSSNSKHRFFKFNFLPESHTIALLKKPFQLK